MMWAISYNQLTVTPKFLEEDDQKAEIFTSGR